MNFKKNIYVFTFILTITLLLLPVPFRYESDGIVFSSGFNYFFHRWIGESYDVNNLQVLIWILSNSVISLFITRILINWDKRNGRFYSILGMIFLIFATIFSFFSNIFHFIAG